MGLAGTVYIAWLEDTNLVKIGFTRGKARDRVKSWSTGSPGRVLVIKEIGGSERLEQELHARYAEHQVEASGREWFEMSEAMLSELGLPNYLRASCA